MCSDTSPCFSLNVNSGYIHDISCSALCKINVVKILRLQWTFKVKLQLLEENRNIVAVGFVSNSWGGGGTGSIRFNSAPSQPWTPHKSLLLSSSAHTASVVLKPNATDVLRIT